MASLRSSGGATPPARAALLRRIAAGLLAAAVAAPVPTHLQEDAGAPPMPFACVLFSHEPLERVPPDALPATLGDRARTFAERYDAFQPSLPVPEEPGEARDIALARRQIERGIVALVDRPDIGTHAAVYARRATIVPAWNGFWTGPLEEAKHADEYLQRNRNTPLAPWLHLFLLHRNRCVFEAAGAAGEEVLRGQARRNYRRSLAQARELGDPLVTFLAEEIDRAPFVCVETTSHPRDPVLGR